MQRLFWLIVFFMSISILHAQSRYRITLPLNSEIILNTGFHILLQKPEFPSPIITQSGRELILVKTDNEKYIWMDGTVENGDTFDYKQQLYGKGNQLLPDSIDFPEFAKTGIHSEKDLKNTKLITGRSVAQITVDARPWGSSGVGFVAEDETIMSVIYADNKIVNKMGLSHPDIARPLFHFWNIAHDFDKISEGYVAKAMIYNRQEVEFKNQGNRGWQESIFNDEILGTGHIEMWRKLTDKELNFLEKNYGNLKPEQMEKLKKELSYIHTGEMVFFYINRYGFYEGHNEYRVDPVSVASVFGLKTIEELHEVTNNDLYSWFAKHFTFSPE